MISDYDRYEFGFTEAAGIVLMGYAAIALIVFLFYHSLMLAVSAGMLSVFTIEPAGRARAQKRRELLLSQFRDLLYSLSSSIAAGRQMEAALAEGLDDLSLIYEQDTPMIGELRYIVKGIFENRGSVETLLKDLARRSGLEDIAGFVDVYSACRRTGGDLEQVIGNASRVLMDKMEIEQEIKALTSQKIFEGKIISVMPVLVVLFLNVFSPDYLEVMYTTVEGRLVMTACLGGILISRRMTERILDITV